jgi:hypothetical protein
MDVVFNVKPEEIPAMLSRRYYTESRLEAVTAQLENVLSSPARTANAGELVRLLAALQRPQGAKARAVKVVLRPAT